MNIVHEELQTGSIKNIEVKSIGSPICDFYVFFSHRIIKVNNKESYRVQLIFDRKIYSTEIHQYLYPIFYLKSKSGFNQIDCINKDFYTNSKNKEVELDKAKIASFNVPLDEISNNEFEIDMSIVKSTKVRSAREVKGKTRIHFNTKPQLVETVSGNKAVVKYTNFISFYISDLDLFSFLNGSYDVGSLELECTFISHKNRLDYDIDIKKNYIANEEIKSHKNPNSVAERKLNQILKTKKYFDGELENFKNGFYDDGTFHVSGKIIGGEQYYDLNKLNFDIESSMGGYYVKNNNKTWYNNISNKVEESPMGENGIVVNNLGKSPYIRTQIKMGDAEFDFKVKSKTNFETEELQKSLSFDIKYFKEIDISYFKSEWEEIDKKDFNEYLKFIEENQVVIK